MSVDEETKPSILSDELKQFYSNHGVTGIEEFIQQSRDNHDDHNSSPSVDDFCYTSLSSRFIRFNPRFDTQEALSQLEDDLPSEMKPTKIPWLSDKLSFYAIPRSYKLAKSKLFQEGKIYGMDCSSGAAVAALLLDEHDHVGTIEKNKAPAGDKMQTSFCVLDLCCAPGLKTCAIVDLLSPNNTNCIDDNSLIAQYPNLSEIRVIGVDISSHRMKLCKKIVTKYHVDRATCGGGDKRNSVKSTNKIKPRISLYCLDGTTFGTKACDPSSMIFDSNIANEEEDYRGKRKRMNKSARARQNKKLKKLVLQENEINESQEDINPAFDRVLVDAECSTDGAVFHMQQRHRQNKSCITTNQKLTNRQTLSDLVHLQKQLIESGFTNLKPGGVLVYSTCSLAAEQNEDVVSWLLNRYDKKAYVLPVSFNSCQAEDGNDSSLMIYEGSLPGTVRFHPNVAARNANGSSSQDTKMNVPSDEQRLYGGGFFLAKIGKR